MATLRFLSGKRPLTVARTGGWALNFLLLALALVILAPFYWMLVNAVLPREQAFALPPDWLPSEITFANFAQVFELIPFGRLVLNSLKLTVIITAGALVTSTLAAYASAGAISCSSSCSRR